MPGGAFDVREGHRRKREAQAAPVASGIRHRRTSLKMKLPPIRSV